MISLLPLYEYVDSVLLYLEELHHFKEYKYDYSKNKMLASKVDAAYANAQKVLSSNTSTAQKKVSCEELAKYATEVSRYLTQDYTKAFNANKTKTPIDNIEEFKVFTDTNVRRLIQICNWAKGKLGIKESIQPGLNLEIIPYEEVLADFDDFELPKQYITKSDLYHQGWIHLTSADSTNDALVYIMPGSYHDLPDALWISVLEVRRKGDGFGTMTINALKDIAKQLGLKALALHALDEKARMFYHKVGFGDFGEDEILYFDNDLSGSHIQEDKIDWARRYATRKHNDTGAVRKHSGEPYIVHPTGVAAIAQAYGLDDSQVQASFLHDTAEDAGATFDDIAEKFGDDVAELVSELTTDEDYRRAFGKESAINRELVNMTSRALDVKLCDMFYNSKDYPGKEQSDRIKRNIAYLRANRDLTDTQEELCQAIAESCRKRFNGYTHLD